MKRVRLCPQAVTALRADALQDRSFRLAVAAELGAPEDAPATEMLHRLRETLRAGGPAPASAPRGSPAPRPALADVPAESLGSVRKPGQGARGAESGAAAGSPSGEAWLAARLAEEAAGAAAAAQARAPPTPHDARV
jgi:hypothetical protein